MRTEFLAEEVLALCGLLSVLMLHDLSFLGRSLQRHASEGLW